MLSGSPPETDARAAHGSPAPRYPHAPLGRAARARHSGAPLVVSAARCAGVVARTLWAPTRGEQLGNLSTRLRRGFVVFDS
jgi:hypothetical protein